MTRRTWLSGMGAAAAMAGGAATVGLPRKVIVGTMMQAFWGKHPGVGARVEELAGAVERMGAEARRKYGRGLDLAILPETSISGEADGDAWARGVAWDGLVGRRFAGVAKAEKSYVVVATYLREEGKRCSNAAVLVGRTGTVEGIYRKVHLVPQGSGFEGGSTPGREFPVFGCDFGKLGMQICYDMEFDGGWRELKKKGAELVAWPTQSPQRAQPCARAMEMGCFIVSSTWRNNASVFEPTGKIVAAIEGKKDGVLVEEIDLSYLILPWSGKLGNGRALRERYGDRVGFRYYEDEDLGIFWSNDGKVGIGEMAREMGLVTAEAELERVRGLYRKAGVVGFP